MRHLVLLLLFSTPLFSMPLYVERVGLDNMTQLAYFRLQLDLSSHPRSALLSTYISRNQIPSGITVLPIEKGLSPFVQTYSNRNAVTPFANCFNTVFSSTAITFWPERFMATEEFNCQLSRHAYPVKDWSFGDIAVLYQNGTPVHSMIYLGWNRDNPAIHFTFSKIGYAIGTRYLVTTLDDMMRFYRSRDLRFFRLSRLDMTDPAQGSNEQNCGYEYQKFSTKFQQSNVENY